MMTPWVVEVCVLNKIYPDFKIIKNNKRNEQKIELSLVLTFSRDLKMNK
jgi:hypothetical protein